MRLPVLKPGKVINGLKQIGFAKSRQTGSHLILINRIIKKIIVVPIHANKDIKRRTLRGIIKQSGLTVKDFLDLLK